AQATITVRTSLIVDARPPSIDIGGASQLSAIGLGGTPPYQYTWSPAGSLDDAHSATPVATPINTTTYSVTVSDAVGASASGSVTVTVNMIVTASANPDAITQ